MDIRTVVSKLVLATEEGKSPKLGNWKISLNLRTIGYKDVTQFLANDPC